jgi:uncharacterized protein (DUF302 family)
MKPLHVFVALTALCVVPASDAADGLIKAKSPLPVKATADKLERLVRQQGLSMFARIDHAAGAAGIGKTLRPTELIIFGSPQAGTLFMECAQTVGIDLPLKALIWEDASAQVWIAYNGPTYLAERHDAKQCAVTEKIHEVLSALVKETVKP